MASTIDHQPAAPTQQPAGIATASLALGIVGFFVGICSVIGLVLGLVARGKAQRGEISPARVKAGIVASVVTLALNLIGGIVVAALLAGGAAGTTSATESVVGSTVSESPAVDESHEEQPVAVESSQTTALVAPAQSAEAPAPSPSSTTPIAEPAEVAALDAGPTVSQKNAVRAAQSYLDYSAFSRSGLVHQLEFEGYSTEDANYGVDHVTVDFDAQAAKAAEQYLEYSSFSHQGLVDQLEFEGYTPAEAEFGVSRSGL